MINVLIVEDDPMVLQLNKRYVESINGFKVVATATDGEKALELLKTNPIELIILDVYMPKLDGIGFLKEMRKRFFKADVILVTASKEAESIDDVFKLGAVDYLIKPFEYERLKSSLENYRGRYELLKGKNVIQQEDLDRITKQNNKSPENRLQKGLHKRTLERIRCFMELNKEAYFTSEEVAEKMKVSRVTVRKYLEYLVEIDELQLEIEYGSIGRPRHLYKYIIRNERC
ncbi:response regulator receiver and unknown domain protein [Alkaliphilus metalliredigens QYMF]|uniref:Transcriptional regulatory protein n=1 Tax=Alkaliphilus metalliredigens (strain QYMF) TaxID=293826 RepID=A6TSE8_ALKMQ|nr:response regulator [Alkaliphilus metalliredigens]ABR49116.1 response regulator receiver and unknown domain protein [Alkaliphilus metalliredigens QYMF]